MGLAQKNTTAMPARDFSDDTGPRPLSPEDFRQFSRKRLVLVFTATVDDMTLCQHLAALGPHKLAEPRRRNRNVPDRTPAPSEILFTDR